MSLRQQLSLLALVVLIVPIFAWQSLVQLEASLRESNAHYLEQTAKALGLLIERQGQFDSSDPVWFVNKARLPIILDGYDDEWADVNTMVAYGSKEARLRLQQYDGKVVAFLRVADKQIAYKSIQNSLINTDYIKLNFVDGNGANQWLISATAPGGANIQQSNGQILRQQAFWQEWQGGYQIEFQLPEKVQALDIIIVEEDSLERQLEGLNIKLDAKPKKLRPLQYVALKFDQQLSAFAVNGSRISLISKAGYTIAQHGSLELNEQTNAPQNISSWILSWLFERADFENVEVLSNNGLLGSAEITSAQQGLVASGWYAYQSAYVSHIAMPIIQQGQVAAVVVVEQNGNAQLSGINSALIKLLVQVLLFSGFLIVVFFGFASLLSWRVRRLGHQASAALQSDGQLKLVSASFVKDEITHLSSDFNELLLQVNHQTEYLRSLANKLSHELRTPLAIVKSSLENIRGLDDDQLAYLIRAQEGSERLSKMLAAMSEANRLEEIIDHSDFEALEVFDFLGQLGAAYKQHVAAHHLVIDLDNRLAGKILHAAPDLIVQLLDKLIDNAIDFAPDDTDILLSTTLQSDSAIIRLENQGPLLPTEEGVDLFNSLVSFREPQNQGKLHLGLGLHIVRLITQAHKGQVSATNNTAQDGVVFTVILPLAGA